MTDNYTQGTQVGFAAEAFDGAEGLDALFPDTPTVDSPIPPPDVHRGRINGVTLQVFDSGATAIKVALTSLDRGFDTEFPIFLPTLFANNIKVDPNTLPTGEVNPLTGELKGDQHTQYARTVRNSKGTATLQVLANIGVKQGRKPTGTPTDTASLTESLNTLLSGCEVVFTRSCDKNPQDPRYADVLRVRNVLDIGEMNNPKRFKNYKKAWE